MFYPNTFTAATNCSACAGIVVSYGRSAGGKGSCIERVLLTLDGKCHKFESLRTYRTCSA